MHRALWLWAAGLVAAISVPAALAVSLDYTAPANGTADSYRLVRNGADLELRDAVTDAVLVGLLFADVSSVNILGEANWGDHLTVDFTGGNPIPSGGVFYDGNDGLFDGLALEGGSFTEVVHTLKIVAPNTAPLRDGSVSLDGAMIEYRDVELNQSALLDETTATHRRFVNEMDGALTWVFQNSSPAVADLSALQSFSFSAQAIQFSNSTGDITLDMGPGRNSVSFDPLQTSLTAPFTINGGPGRDTVNLPNEDLPGGTAAEVTLISGATGEAVITGFSHAITVKEVEIVSDIGDPIRVTGTAADDNITLLRHTPARFSVYFEGMPPLHPGRYGGSLTPEIDVFSVPGVEIVSGDPGGSLADHLFMLAAGAFSGTPADGSFDSGPFHVPFSGFSAVSSQLPMILVDVNSSPGGGGLSWDDALDDIQSAVDLVTPGPLAIAVADGTYPGVVNISDGARIYGGFSGEESDELIHMDSSNPEQNVTILDGQGLGSVVTFDGVRDAGIHGVTITNGSGVSGGGVNILATPEDADLRVESCIIANNMATGAAGGGGIYIEGTPLQSVLNCLIVGNSAPAGLGGGVCAGAGPIQSVSDCVIAGNSALVGGGIGSDGGGVNASRCDIVGNTAFVGGGVALTGAGSTISSSNICGNAAAAGGGCSLIQQSSSTRLIGCHVTSNTGGESGGINMDGLSSPLLSNVLFANNTGYAIREASAGNNAEVRHCVFDQSDSGDYFDGDTMAAYSGAAIDGLGVNNTGNLHAAATFIGGLTGTWSAAPPPTYDGARNRTVLFVTGGSLEPGALVNAQINTDTGQRRRDLITANGAASVEVVGDVTSFTAAGDPFAIIDEQPAPGSAVIDAGETSTFSSSDRLKIRRPVGPAFDVGAYEAHPVLVSATFPADFGERDIDDGPSPPLKLVELTNSGNYDMAFSEPPSFFSDDAASFAFDGDPGGTPVAPGETREVRVTFDPSRLGSHSASLYVATTAGLTDPFPLILDGVGFQDTGDLVDQLVGILPAGALDQTDVNGDTAFDAADIVSNVNSGH